jgi:hypothetical protein
MRLYKEKQRKEGTQTSPETIVWQRWMNNEWKLSQ